MRRSILRFAKHIKTERRRSVVNLMETIMKIASVAIAATLIAGSAISLPALAATSLFATEPAATAACATDEVVWIDLDRGRFYHKGQTNFAKSNNGGYACAKAAHAQYREGHE
jgi:hypothetical protein